MVPFLKASVLGHRRLERLHIPSSPGRLEVEPEITVRRREMAICK